MPIPKFVSARSRDIPSLTVSLPFQGFQDFRELDDSAGFFVNLGMGAAILRRGNAESLATRLAPEGSFALSRDCRKASNWKPDPHWFTWAWGPGELRGDLGHPGRNDCSECVIVSNPTIDSFGRRITYVRMSVTGRCDLRFRSCLEEAIPFLFLKDILAIEEVVAIAVNTNENLAETTLTVCRIVHQCGVMRPGLALRDLH